MKSNQSPRILSAAIVVYLAAAATFSCERCPACSPTLNCGLQVGRSNSSGGSSSGGNSGADPSILLSDRPCSLAPKCIGQVDPAYACMVYDKCDDASGFCKVKLGDPSYQCAAGSMRNCTTRPAGTRGVIVCDATVCTWPAAASGCVECGHSGEPCCVGGCDQGLTCKTPPNTPDPKNSAGDKCL